MSLFSPLRLGLAAPLLVLSQTASADLTPAEVWGDWRQYMEGMGYQITATETPSGGNLTVSDIALNFPTPDNSASMSMTLGTIGFNQNSDGSVDIAMPDTLPIVVNGADNTGSNEQFTLTMRYTQTGQSMRATGSAQEITYDYAADAVGLILDQLQVGADVYGEENAKINVTGTGLRSTTTMTIGDLRGYDQTMQIEALNYDIFVNNPQEAAQVGLTGNVAGVGMTGTGAIPLQMPDSSDVSAMLQAGFDVDGTLTYAQGASSINVADPANGDFAMNTTSQGGSFGVSMGSDGLAYDLSQTNLSVTANVAELPFPVQMAMAKSAFNLALPVSQSDDPQDFAAGITMGDFTMSDVLWSIFDPAGQLPRDAATIMVDLAGKARLLVDFMDPNAVAAFGGDQPAELISLTLRTLVLDAVGARLDGSGAVTFDGTGPAMVPGLGNPVGSVNLSLVGANGLLDKLVAMGLLPQDQAMGARMMMGLFAVPGDAPDSMTSKIDMTPDGQVLANGQRIR